jgi:dolichol kinase
VPAKINLVKKIELMRKSLHILALAIPFLYYSLGKYQTLKIVFLALVLFSILEYFRIKKGKIFGFEKLARNRERRSLGAHIYLTLSALIILIVFPREIAIGSILSSSFGDASAALIGERFGKLKFRNKTLEGFASYFLTSTLILLIFLPLPIAILSSLFGALVELIGIPPNDNFSVPLSVAICSYLLKEIFS